MNHIASESIPKIFVPTPKILFRFQNFVGSISIGMSAIPWDNLSQTLAEIMERKHFVSNQMSTLKGLSTILRQSKNRIQFGPIRARSPARFWPIFQFHLQ